MAKSIAANSLYNFALKFFRLILPILVSTYILHTLDPTLYGIFSDAETWVAIALIFGSPPTASGRPPGSGTTGKRAGSCLPVCSSSTW